MDEENNSSDKKENNYNIKYPSIHLLLIIIIGLFILSFIIASFSLIFLFSLNSKFFISLKLYI